MALSEEFNAIPRLFGNAIEQMGKLVQNEAQLARAELAEKIARAGIGAGYVAAAAVLCVPVLVILLIALALWFVELGLSPVIAHLASAAVGAVAAAILAALGVRYLNPRRLRPNVTLGEIRSDVATVKDLVK